MAVFVMIHGAWHGGWCFDQLRPLIEGKGHRMIAPDLPGMGGTAESRAAVTLASWGDFAASLCRDAKREDPKMPVILCGHSRGGIVISEAAERAPESVDALIYICAMLIPSGMSRADMRATGAANPGFDAIRQAVPGGTQIDPRGAAAIFAQLSPPELAAAAIAKLEIEPDRPSATPLALSEARYGSVPRHYVECHEDRAITIADQWRMQAMQPCASVTTLSADHSPFLSAPEALASALFTVAEQLCEGS